MATVKTGKIVKYLISLFAAAALLILAGGAKKMFTSESHNEEAAKIKAAALLYVSAADDKQELQETAEKAPDFLLFTASSANLKLIDDEILK